MKLPKILLAAGLAALALPAVASADSIVYIDQGNVWSACPDGARKVQLTSGGGWHSPTQADDGTIAAVQGTGPIVVMARDGRPLRTITTPTAKSGDGGTFAPRPVELSFSPDGRRSRTPTSRTPARSRRPAARSSARRSTRTRTSPTATPIEVYGNQFSVSDPEWVTNAARSSSAATAARSRSTTSAPATTRRRPWMVPNGDMGDGELTRDGTRLAVTSDYGANKKLTFFAVNGDVTTEFPPAYPDFACETTSGDERYGDPSWSPGRRRARVREQRGIKITRFTQFGPTLCATAERLAPDRDRHRARLGSRRPARGGLRRRTRPSPTRPHAGPGAGRAARRSRFAR